jgi:hypothetical protein
LLLPKTQDRAPQSFPPSPTLRARPHTQPAKAAVALLSSFSLPFPFAAMHLKGTLVMRRVGLKSECRSAALLPRPLASTGNAMVLPPCSVQGGALRLLNAAFKATVKLADTAESCMRVLTGLLANKRCNGLP